MLKRQRAASPPPPSSSNIPLVSDTPGDSIAERNFKKQRTAPPSLDGRTRGWGQDQELSTEEDDGEEYYIDEDTEDMVPSPSPAGYVHPTLHAENEYKSANTVLRELHTLHQHRMLFSTAQPSGNHSTAHLMVAHTSPPLLHGPSPLRNQIGKDKMTTTWSQHPPTMTKEKTSEDDNSVLEEEATRVAERYEGLNKFVHTSVLATHSKPLIDPGFLSEC
ncbi:hypothetical protein D9619_003329 [Psilocybe cf. subviscida]|uniref:Uncharacterized protein n=1 Tax=Psilocybe cf. subviscida TaxID=2480587 RepID=A0A8H5ETI3_9AGAR|nr:hypothetical protein D9619_003329 [Psilocybe cf. subviscida]